MRALLSKAIDSLQEKFPPNRIVVLLTPVVFVPAAAWVTGYVARQFPGLPVFDSAQVTGLMVAGALSAVIAANKWLDGWQKHQEILADPSRGNPDPSGRRG